MTGLVPSLQQPIMPLSSFLHPCIIAPLQPGIEVSADGIPDFRAEGNALRAAVYDSGRALPAVSGTAQYCACNSG